MIPVPCELLLVLVLEDDEADVDPEIVAFAAVDAADSLGLSVVLSVELSLGGVTGTGDTVILFEVFTEDCDDPFIISV